MLVSKINDERWKIYDWLRSLRKNFDIRRIHGLLLQDIVLPYDQLETWMEWLQLCS